MRSSKIIILLLVFLGFTFMGYQCSSSELTSAKLYIQQKNYDKALPLLEQEVQKNPKSNEGFYLLGLVYGEKEQYDKMIDAYNKSLAINQEFKDYIDQSKLSHWATLFNKGVKAFQDGTSTDVEDSSKVLLSRAANYFEESIKIMPDSMGTYKNLAFVYLSAGNYDAAMEPLKVMIEKEKSLDGYRFVGEILYEKGNQLKATDETAANQSYEEAIIILEEGRKLYPNDPDILLALSNSYIAANKLDIAKDVFKAGVEAEPENKYYRYNYGVLLLGGEEYAEAEKQFLKAIELDPEYENAIYNLSVTYVKWGTYLNKVADEKGETSSEYKDKYQLALPYLEKVVQMKTDDAVLWELLGKVYTVLGMQEDASNAFAKADQLRQQ